MKAYPMKVENIGDDSYKLMSRGHHDPNEFMREVRSAGYNWPLGMPQHTWFKTIPDRSGECSCIFIEVLAGTRGAFPVTFATEAYGEDQYEVLVTQTV